MRKYNVTIGTGDLIVQWRLLEIFFVLGVKKQVYKCREYSYFIYLAHTAEIPKLRIAM